MTYCQEWILEFRGLRWTLSKGPKTPR